MFIDPREPFTYGFVGAIFGLTAESVDEPPDPPGDPVVLSVQRIGMTGLSPTYVAASADGHVYAAGGREFMHIKNGGGADVTVTIDGPNPCDFGHMHSRAFDVAAGAERMIAVADMARHRTSDGLVYFAFSDTTAVTVAVFSA